MRTRLIVLTIALLLSVFTSTGAHATPLQITSVLPEYVGEHGGAFRQMNIVGKYALVIEGANNVLVLDATDKWTGGSSTLHQPPNLVGRRHIDTRYIFDLHAEMNNGLMEVFVLYEAFSDRNYIEYLEFNSQTGQFVSKFTIVGEDTLDVGKFIYTSSSTDALAYSRTAPSQLVRHWRTTTFNEKWYAMDVDNGRVFVGGNESIKVFFDPEVEPSSTIEVGQTISQIVANGDYVMVRHTPFQNTGPEDHDFSVFKLKGSRYERVLTVNDRTGLRWSFEPNTTGTIAEGHLLVAGGWNGMMAWDIETGRQLLEANRLSSMYAAEIVRVGVQVYLLDHYMGIRTTSWGEDGQGGGYFQTRPLIPSLSDVEMVRSNGRYIIAGGKAGIYVFNMADNRITGYTTWFTRGEGFPMGNNYDMELVGDELWAGDEDSFYRYYVGDGSLKKLGSVNWTGGRFALISSQVVSITTDYGRPAVLSVFNPFTGEVTETTTVAHDQHGVDIEVSGNRIYVLTETGTDSRVVAYTYSNGQLVQSWKMERYNMIRLKVSGDLLWIGSRGPSISAYRDTGSKPVYIDGASDDTRLTIGAFGPWGFVNTGSGMNVYKMNGGGMLKLGSYISNQPGSGWYMEDVVMGPNGQVVMGLGTRGIEIAKWQWATHRLYLPSVVRNGNLGWCSDTEYCSIIDDNCVCGGR